MEVLRDVTLIQNFFLGMFLPLVIALINQTRWPAPVKGLVALAVCVIAATVVEIIRGELTFTNWGGTALIVLATAFGFYTHLWKPSKIAPGVEAATSLSPAQNGR